jgi:hypothetical protein
LAGLLAILIGCTENAPPRGASSPPPTPPPLADEPISVQIRRAEPRLGGLPYRVLLDFEKGVDLAFLDVPAMKTDSGKAHTGRSSLRLDSAARSFGVKLSSAVGGAFPGAWTVAGAHFYCDAPASVAVSYAPAKDQPPAIPPRSVPLVPGKWTPVMVDLTRLIDESRSAGVLNFSIDGDADVFCDDVILINNERTVKPKSVDPQDPGWTVRQRGFSITASRPGRFSLTLKSIEERPDGWAMHEANEVRARFTSGDGQEMTLYADGRQYTDGKLNLLGPRPRYADTLARQQEAPAEVEIAEEYGRLDRDTPGDRNNDGYNELRGAYQLAARTSRLEVTLKPRGGSLAVPVLEIAGLKPGKALVTVEGQLVDRSTRLDDGRVLVELPLILRRAATVNVSIK